MNKLKNYYQILHVQADAPAEVIRSSYRTLMQKLKMHPDLGGNPQEAALVNEAYSVLTNASTRRKYDASLASMGNVNAEVSANTRNRKSQNSSATNIDSNNHCVFCRTAHNLGNLLQADSRCSICASALFPATKQAFEQQDQRIIQRIDRQWDVTFYTQWPSTRSYSGKTHDVSLNGMQLLTTTALETNQIIKITSSTLDAVARVVNRREDRGGLLKKRWRVGLEFLTLRLHQTHGTFVKLDA